MQQHRRTILRRATICTVLLTPVAAAIASLASRGQEKGTQSLTLVVLLAKGCPFCKRWLERNKPELEAWPSKSQINIYYIEKDSLRRPFVQADFPRELQKLYSALTTEEKMVGVPAFRIYAGEDVVSREVGLSSWNRKAYPALRRLAEVAAAAESGRVQRPGSNG